MLHSRLGQSEPKLEAEYLILFSQNKLARRGAKWNANFSSHMSFFGYFLFVSPSRVQASNPFGTHKRIYLIWSSSWVSHSICPCKCEMIGHLSLLRYVLDWDKYEWVFRAELWLILTSMLPSWTLCRFHWDPAQIIISKDLRLRLIIRPRQLHPLWPRPMEPRSADSTWTWTRKSTVWSSHLFAPPSVRQLSRSLSKLGASPRLLEVPQGTSKIAVRPPMDALTPPSRGSNRCSSSLHRHQHNNRHHRHRHHKRQFSSSSSSIGISRSHNNNNSRFRLSMTSNSNPSMIRRQAPLKVVYTIAPDSRWRQLHPGSPHNRWSFILEEVATDLQPLQASMTPSTANNNCKILTSLSCNNKRNNSNPMTLRQLMIRFEPSRQTTTFDPLELEQPPLIIRTGT